MDKIDALSDDQLWDTDCLATIACPNDRCSSGRVLTVNKTYETGLTFSESGTCQECIDKGPKLGRVWALLGMQEKCPWKANVFSDAMHKNPNRKYDSGVMRAAQSFDPCHGTGFVAKRDLGALLAVGAGGRYAINLVTLGSEYPDRFRFRAWCRGYQGDGYEADEACLRAVAQALVASGATLGVTA